ncbi:hypothetical protein EV122DRAFT_281458 [Schizophyllum commune]
MSDQNSPGLTRAGGGLGASAPTLLSSLGREQWTSPVFPSPTTAKHLDNYYVVLSPASALLITLYLFTDPLTQLSSNAHHQSTPNALTTFYIFRAVTPTPTIRDGHLPLAAIIIDVALNLLSSMRAQQARHWTSSRRRPFDVVRAAAGPGTTFDNIEAPTYRPSTRCSRRRREDFDDSRALSAATASAPLASPSPVLPHFHVNATAGLAPRRHRNQRFGPPPPPRSV